MLLIHPIRSLDDAIDVANSRSVSRSSLIIHKSNQVTKQHHTIASSVLLRRAYGSQIPQPIHQLTCLPYPGASGADQHRGVTRDIAMLPRQSHGVLSLPGKTLHTLVWQKDSPVHHVYPLERSFRYFQYFFADIKLCSVSSTDSSHNDANWRASRRVRTEYVTGWLYWTMIWFWLITPLGLCHRRCQSFAKRRQRWLRTTFVWQLN